MDTISKKRLAVGFFVLISCLKLYGNIILFCYSLYRTIVSSLVVRLSFVHPLKLGKDYI